MIIHSRYSVLCNALACSCFLHLLTGETLNFEPMTRSRQELQEHVEIDWPLFWQCMVLLKFRFIEQSFRHRWGVPKALQTWPSAALRCVIVSRVAEDLVPTWERERLSWPHPAEVEIFEISFKSLDKGGQKSWLYASNMPVLKIESLIKV